MAKASVHHPPQLHVVFDTNVLFTEAEDKLLNNRVSEFLLSDVNKLGIPLTWHLPSIVKSERRRQMIERGSQILRPLNKLEALLGISIGVTPQFLSTKVDEVIDREMSRHKMQGLEIDTAAVDWSEIIRLAVEKEPPFSPSSEKGFKDALVLETFAQLVEKLPKSPSSCRVAFICADELLRDTAKRRTSGRNNVRVVESLDDLQTIINAIASDIPQEAIEKIIAKAKLLFYTPGSGKSLYGKWEIAKKVQTLSTYRTAALRDDRIASKATFIGATAFIKKEGQTLNLVTEIRSEFIVSEPYNALAATTKSEPGGNIGILGNHIYTLPSATETTKMANALSDSSFRYKIDQLIEALGSPPPSPAFQTTKTRKAIHTAAVVWTATYTTHGNLTKPGFVKVEDRETVWQEI